MGEEEVVSIMNIIIENNTKMLELQSMLVMLMKKKELIKQKEQRKEQRKIRKIEYNERWEEEEQRRRQEKEKEKERKRTDVSQNELLTYLWYLNLGCTLRGLGVIQKFNNDDNDD